MRPPSASAAVAAAHLASQDQVCPRLRHIITGSFNTVFLHLLTFDSLTRSLSVTLSVPAQGPHQWLALGSMHAAGPSNTLPPSHRVVYATTWDDEARRVSAWRVGLEPGRESIEYINSKAIPAAGSYLSVQPPPYESRTSPSYGVRSRLKAKRGSSSSSQGSSEQGEFLYQAGGPTGEVFSLDSATGEIVDQRQRIVFLRGGEEELARGADTSRKSLRYGAHNVDFDVNGLAYIADLGRNAVLVYSRDEATGELTLQTETTAPEDGDGPRHVVPSPDGRWVFSVMEHTSYVDAYRVEPSTYKLTHKQRISMLPPKSNVHDWRGDTVRLSPSGNYLFATTRGKDASVRGWVKAWQLNLNSEEQPISPGDESEGSASLRYQTPTSGGKGNAWEWAPRYPLSSPEYPLDSATGQEKEDDLAVLTDDDEGYVLVMQWDGQEIREVARTRLPGRNKDKGGNVEFIPHNGKQGDWEGASHAIWLD